MSRRGSLALAAILSLWTGGCGDDGEASDSEGTSESASATDSAAASTTTDGDPSTGSDSETTGAGTTGGESDPVWMTPYCYPVSATKWLDPWEAEEADVVALVNEVRATGTSCGSNGDFAPAGPLKVSPHLTCAARAHSQDMSERGFFGHVNPDGEGPSDRIDETGYAWTAVGENIAGGPMTAADAVDGWLASDDHCANLMNPTYTEIGVGLYEGAGQFTFYWTQTFGTPN
jgi:uncharacterized protein YkwD